MKKINFGKIRLFKYKIKFWFKKNVNFPNNGEIGKNVEIETDNSAKLEIGQNITLKNNTSLKVRKNANCKIGNDVFFNKNCDLICRKKVIIGNDVLIGQNVIICDNDHNYKSNNIKNEFALGDIIIENNCWIGANSIILKGSHIKKNCVIAAGSIVNGTIEENSLYYNEKNAKTKLIERGKKYE